MYMHRYYRSKNELVVWEVLQELKWFDVTLCFMLNVRCNVVGVSVEHSIFLSGQMYILSLDSIGII